MNQPPKKRGTPLLALLLGTILFLIAGNGVLLFYPALASPKVLYIIGLSLSGIGLILAIAYAKIQRPVSEAPARVSAVLPPQHDGEVDNEQAVVLLTLLQEKGRLVDFIMEEIAPYSNEQIGAAARVVHQGCREVVLEAFSPCAISAEKENSTVTLDGNFNTAEYKLVGKVGGQPPYTGKLVHPGWKARQVKLPRPATSEEKNATLVLQPAEVSL